MVASSELGAFADLAYEQLESRTSLFAGGDGLVLLTRAILDLASGGITDERIDEKTALILGRQLVRRYQAKNPINTQPSWRALAKANGLR